MTPITAAATIQRIADSGLDISTEDYRALVEVVQWLVASPAPTGLCIHCYEQAASAQFNNMYCAKCAKKISNAWEAEWNERVREAAQA